MVHVLQESLCLVSERTRKQIYTLGKRDTCNHGIRYPHPARPRAPDALQMQNSTVEVRIKKENEQRQARAAEPRSRDEPH